MSVTRRHKWRGKRESEAMQRCVKTGDSKTVTVYVNQGRMDYREDDMDSMFQNKVSRGCVASEGCGVMVGIRCASGRKMRGGGVREYKTQHHRQIENGNAKRRTEAAATMNNVMRERRWSETRSL